MKLKFSSIFLIICVVFTIQANAQVAYKSGEVLKFKVKYGWFKTSEATLKVYDANLNGTPVYRIHGYGRSTGMLDWFFKVRDNFESFIDKKNQHPLKFIRNTNEGGYTKNKMIRFKHDRDSAIVHDYKHNKISKHFIEERTQDFISAFYALRNEVDENNLVKGEVFFLNLFFDEENFSFKVEYLGEEVLETEFGEVQTLVFRPYVQAERVFKEEESVTIWISKDQNKIPLKIEAELAVGSITASLDKYKNLAHPFSSQLNNR